MADIFISYVHEDHEIAQSLARFLREPKCCNPPAGASVPAVTYNVFFTGDDWLLYAGEIWLQRIREELTAAKVLLSLFSPYSVERSWVHFEAGAAWLANKAVIPVCVGGLTVKDLRIPYSGIQGVTLTDSSSAYYLLRSVWKHFTPETPRQLNDVVPPLPFAPEAECWKKLEAALKAGEERARPTS
jgi:hypothetical protein